MIGGGNAIQGISRHETKGCLDKPYRRKAASGNGTAKKPYHRKNNGNLY